jgi:hypothetical protein
VRLGHLPLGGLRVGASVKSMNFGGVPLVSDTRHLTRRSRGLVFLALAIRTPLVPLATDTLCNAAPSM